MQLSNIFVSLAVITASVSAVPLLNKRIAQTIIDSVQGWENACIAANGGAQCNPIAVNASSALLAGADPCAQQDAGDIMVNVAKGLNNNQAMITAAQIFVQQPRNSPNSVAVNYCQHAPQNTELNGFFQCQFQGDNEQKFANGAALGAPGTIPFGLSAPVNPPGSCPAHPQGPIPDGVQLSSLVSTPGTPFSSSGTANNSSTASNSTSSNSTTSGSGSSSDAGDTSFPAPQQSGSDSNGNGTSSAQPSDSGVAPSSTSGSSNNTASAPASATPAASSGASGSGGFQLSNGQNAQKQNAQFGSLTANSACTEGQQACVNNGFAQCVGGKFAITACAGGTQCFALPLVNKPGTSIACTTQGDAASRIANTGATGGITGSS